jgi:hypothetical protein
VASSTGTGSAERRAAREDGAMGRMIDDHQRALLVLGCSCALAVKDLPASLSECVIDANPLGQMCEYSWCCLFMCSRKNFQ